jgi:nicotinamide-nucleotide amidase
MKAAIFTIGTEITDGQITDRNSQWMSEQLTDFGVDVLLHVSIPDDKKQIVDFLNATAESFDLLVFSGGLGPTSDDLTRFAIADYLKLPLVMHEPSWNYIFQRLSSRGITIREEHKAQAMIFKNAIALSNSAGSAPGIQLEQSGKIFFLLPGPPVELQAIWNNHIAPFFKSKNIQNNQKLKKWMCTGIVESELAHITDTYFANKSYVIKTGFRIHKPNVEAKVWYCEAPEVDLEFKNFEKLIAQYLISGSTV